MTNPLDALNLYVFCPHCGSNLISKTIDNEQVRKCSKCDFIFWNNPKPVVSMLITRNRKVLMVQRARIPLKGFWCLPGGFINAYETPAEGIKREVEEELSTEAQVKKIVGVYRIDNDPRGIHIDIIYKGEIANEPKFSSEHQGLEFFDPNNLPEKIAYKHREAILDWYKSGSQHG